MTVTEEMIEAEWDRARDMFFGKPLVTLPRRTARALATARAEGRAEGYAKGIDDAAGVAKTYSENEKRQRDIRWKSVPSRAYSGAACNHRAEAAEHLADAILALKEPKP